MLEFAKEALYMLVDIFAQIQRPQSLAPNRPIGDWPVSFQVYQATDAPKTIPIHHGTIRVSELRPPVMNSRVIPPDNNAIPQFVKDLEARKPAVIHNLDISQVHLQSLIDSVSFPYLP
jgi:hypothetical protein